jgi:hypothetical protein
MPPLPNQRHEDFAQGRARGLTQSAAYTLAGFAQNRGAGSRLEGRKAVKERVEELVAEAADIRKASLEATIIALLNSACIADELKTAVGVKEARLARLEAHRLAGQLAARCEAAAWIPPRAMTEAEWDAKYGPDAPASR